MWSTLINVLDRILQMGKLVVLGQLLAPGDFGLMGIALLTMAALEQFSRLGFDEALIQRKEDDINEYLNTAWDEKSVVELFLAFLRSLLLLTLLRRLENLAPRISFVSLH